MLPGLRAIRELNIPVDRMERVASMPCNNTSLPFMLTLDSNKNPSSNHPSKQSFILLSFRQALVGWYMSLSPSSLLEFNAQGREAPCQGIHLGLEFFGRLHLLVARHGKYDLHSNRNLGEPQSFRATLKSIDDS